MPPTAVYSVTTGGQRRQAVVTPRVTPRVAGGGVAVVSKREFLERMRAARADFNEAISGLTEDQITGDIVAGEWTVKDIVAHLAAWQVEALRAIEQAERGEESGPLIDESVDEWNQRRVEERRRLPLVDVIQEFTESHDELLAA